VRLLRFAALGLTLAAIAGGGGLTATASTRSHTFSAGAAALETRWKAEVADGVPAASLAPLRRALAASPYRSAASWSPLWWGDDGGGLVAQLSVQTDRVRADALSAARARAALALSEWHQLVSEHTVYLAVAAPDRVEWPVQLAAATTPNAVEALAQRWTVAAGQARELTLAVESETRPFGGAPGLVARARTALAAAQAGLLDTGSVATLVSALSGQLAADAPTPDTVHALAAALPALEALVASDHDVTSAVSSLQALVNRAVSAGTPNAAGFRTQAAALAAALRSASTSAALSAVSTQVAALQRSVAHELATTPVKPAPPVAAPAGPSCGQGPGPRSIAISLSHQQAVFYENGCEVNRTLVTTGKPGLRTPTGVFHIFYKQSPFTFISPWPKGSPNYYYPSTANWAMEFAGGGYFLHDAPWQPQGSFGPGSQNSGNASHGCVHIPSSVMSWLFGWAGYGTTVTISA
jgi:lipoprotein-anchoring transpeptidase ErfK/SrfK